MAETNDVYWLVSGAGEIALDGGQKFWKELIREGRWTNPRAGFTIQVDRDRLDTWKQQFDEMLDAGIRVPVPWGHSYDPRDNAGFVEEIELRDGGLWGLLNVPNEQDAAKLGSTVCAVSVSINPNFVDGSGRNWGQVIEHVALTNYPIVTDQSEFIQAANENGDEKRAIVLELAAEEPVIDLDAIRSRFGIEGELSRENLVDAIKLKFDEVTAELEICRAELMELRAARLEQETGSRPEPLASSTQDSEPGTSPAEASAQAGRNSELTNRLYQLELEQAERDVDEALRLGKFTRPAAEALRQLITVGIERKYSFGPSAVSSGPSGNTGTDIAGIARGIIANTPAGAAVDMTGHTRLHPVPNPSGAAMTDEKAAQLAKENKALAGV